MFLAASLAGKSADEAGSREAFGWLDRRQKGAINSADVKQLTGEVRYLLWLSSLLGGMFVLVAGRDTHMSLALVI